MLGEDEITLDTFALQTILAKLCQITEVNKTAENFGLNGLEKKKVAKTYTSLIEVDVPQNRDSGGIHLMGRRTLKLWNGKDI